MTDDDGQPVQTAGSPADVTEKKMPFNLGKLGKGDGRKLEKSDIRVMPSAPPVENEEPLSMKAAKNIGRPLPPVPVAPPPRDSAPSAQTTSTGASRRPAATSATQSIPGPVQSSASLSSSSSSSSVSSSSQTAPTKPAALRPRRLAPPPPPPPPPTQKAPPPPSQPPLPHRRIPPPPSALSASVPASPVCQAPTVLADRTNVHRPASAEPRVGEKPASGSSSLYPSLPDPQAYYSAIDDVSDVSENNYLQPVAVRKPPAQNLSCSTNSESNDSRELWERMGSPAKEEPTVEVGERQDGPSARTSEQPKPNVAVPLEEEVYEEYEFAAPMPQETPDSGLQELSHVQLSEQHPDEQHDVVPDEAPALQEGETPRSVSDEEPPQRQDLPSPSQHHQRPLSAQMLQMQEVIRGLQERQRSQQLQHTAHQHEAESSIRQSEEDASQTRPSMSAVARPQVQRQQRPHHQDELPPRLPPPPPQIQPPLPHRRRQQIPPQQLSVEREHEQEQPNPQQGGQQVEEHPLQQQLLPQTPSPVQNQHLPQRQPRQLSQERLEVEESSGVFVTSGEGEDGEQHSQETLLRRTVSGRAAYFRQLSQIYQSEGRPPPILPKPTPARPRRPSTNSIHSNVAALAAALGPRLAHVQHSQGPPAAAHQAPPPPAAPRLATQEPDNISDSFSEGLTVRSDSALGNAMTAVGHTAVEIGRSVTAGTPGESSNTARVGTVEKAVLDAFMDSPMVKEVLAMEIPEDLVRQAIEKQIQLTGDTFSSTSGLMDAVFDQSPPTSTSTSTTAFSTAATALPLKPDEIHRLIDQRFCKICMEEEVCIVFMPCAHLACCKDCSDKLSDCPICRTAISQKMRTYLA